MKFKYMLRGFGIGVIFTSLILAFSFYHKEASLSDAEIMARASKLGMVKAEDAKGAATDNQELSEQLAREAAEKKEEASGAGIAAEKAGSSTAGEEGEKEAAGKMEGEEEEKQPAKEGEAENKQGSPVDEGNRADTADTENALAGEGKTAGEADEEAGTESLQPAGPGQKPAQAGNEEKESGVQQSTARVVRDEELVSIHVEPGMYSSQVTDILEKNGIVKDGADLDWYLCEKNYAPNIQAGDFLVPKDADYEKIAKILTRQE